MPYFSFELWESSAQNLTCAASASCGGDGVDAEKERELYAYNARNLVTMWGPTGQIGDYSSRLWGGLIGSYYRERWAVALGSAVEFCRDGAFASPGLWVAPCVLQRGSQPVSYLLVLEWHAPPSACSGCWPAESLYLRCGAMPITPADSNKGRSPPDTFARTIGQFERTWQRNAPGSGYTARCKAASKSSTGVLGVVAMLHQQYSGSVSQGCKESR